MKIGIYNPASDSSTKPWFISSIAVTLLLIFLLGGNLIFSFTVLDSFRNEELRAERSSWKLLLYAAEMNMATRVSALSGNLKWKKTYETARPKLEEVLREIPERIAAPEVRQSVGELKRFYQIIREIDKRVYELVSRGEKEKALQLLAGWSYTKNRLEFQRTARSIVDAIQQRIVRRTAVQKRLSLGFLFIAAAAVLYLVFSWAVTIRLWRRQIGEKRRAEAQVRQSEEKYRKLIDTSPDSIAFIDDQGKILTSNPAMAIQLGAKTAAMEGKQLSQVISGEAKERHMKRGLDAISREEVISSEDERGGRFFESYYVPVYTADARNAFQMISKDVTEQKLMEQRLKEMSLYDSLTSLYARSFFEEEMRRLGDSRHLPLGIIICDVDGLKLINDAMGHDAGDSLLMTAANILRSSFRASDVVARIGGDEFVALLPNTGEETVYDRCRRIQEEIDRHNSKDSRNALSVSLGYAVTNEEPVDTDGLFKRADDAMYQAKLRERPTSRQTIIQAITKTMEERDYMDLGHAERLREYSRRLGEAAGLSEDQLEDLDLLSRYHDLGKVGIPEHILYKPGPLTEDERAVMKNHCEIGHRIALSISEISHIADYILKHHEWWNGEGYPRGLAGKEIPLESRIVAITDAYDAMTSRRHSGEVKSHSEAVEELRCCAGIQFDPELVEIFVEMMGEEVNR